MKKTILASIFGLFFAIATHATAAGISVIPPKFEFAGEPGETITADVAIRNLNDTELVLQTSIEDFVASGESGRQRFIDASDESANTYVLSRWISIDDSLIVVKPGEMKNVTFHIKIPQNAEPGGHFGVIFFSPPFSGDGNIRVKQRIGSILLIRVTGDIVESGNLKTFAITKEKSEETSKNIKNKSFFSSLPVNFTMRFKNDGNVHIKPTGKITITDTFGRQLRRIGTEIIFNKHGARTGEKIVDHIPVNGNFGNVLPDSTRGWQMPFTGEQELFFDPKTGEQKTRQNTNLFGKFTAEMTLSYGENKTTIPVQTLTFWIIPWQKVLGFIAIITIFSIAITKYRRHSRENMIAKLKKEIKSK